MGIVRFALRQGWKIAKKVDDIRVAKQMPVHGVHVESDIPYLTGGNVMHQLNLYYPAEHAGKARKLLPVVIDIHGGGLMYGNKELNQRYCEYLATQGFCVMGMSYRLLPMTDLQGMVQDIFASMHWLAAYGARHGFDMGHVFLTGDSAGGHLASLVLCIQNSDKLQKIYDVKQLPFSFRAAAISNGVCEMHDYFGYPKSIDRRVDREIVRMILGKKKRAPWKAYMNFSQVIGEVKTLPPLLVIGSETDGFYRQTQWLIENLEARNVDFEVLVWKSEDGPHLGHVFQILHWEWAESRETNLAMLDFFRKKMGE